MELTPYQLALIAGGFTIAGALIAVLSGHYLAKRLASYTYRLHKLDEVRSSIIFHYSGVYPVVSKWPNDIAAYLKTKNPDLCVFVQQCELHMCEENFQKLIDARDKYLEDVEGYIARQKDPAELFYTNAHPEKGQVRLRDNIKKILASIK
jgi:hypothetical protein